MVSAPNKSVIHRLQSAYFFDTLLECRHSHTALFPGGSHSSLLAHSKCLASYKRCRFMPACSSVPAEPTIRDVDTEPLPHCPILSPQAAWPWRIYGGPSIAVSCSLDQPLVASQNLPDDIREDTPSGKEHWVREIDSRIQYTAIFRSNALLRHTVVGHDHITAVFGLPVRTRYERTTWSR